MEDFKKVIDLEENRLKTLVGKMAETLAKEGEDRQNSAKKIKALKQKQLEAEGWREKREIEEEIVYFQEQNSRRLHQETNDTEKPLFWHSGNQR